MSNNKTIVKALCKLSELANKTEVNQTTWVTGSKNSAEKLVYNGNYTIDQVRGHYGKTTGVGKDNARAVRLSSYNKKLPTWA